MFIENKSLALTPARPGCLLLRFRVQGAGEDAQRGTEVTSRQMVNQRRLELEAVLDILLLWIRGLRVIITALLILGLLNV